MIKEIKVRYILIENDLILILISLEFIYEMALLKDTPTSTLHPLITDEREREKERKKNKEREREQDINSSFKRERERERETY